MVFWIVLAGMTAVVLVLVVLPILRSARPDAGRASFDLQVYRDQLAELDKDREAGLIDEAAAQAARNEIARRILAAEGNGSTDGRADRSRSPRWSIISAVAIIPAIALSGYIYVGRPDLPDQPRAERMAKAVKSGDMMAMLVQVEEHLAKNPNDAKGWLVLAPAYRRLGRFNDAADAFRKAIALSEPRADLMTEYGETLVQASEGVITEQAREVFERALAIDKTWPKARFYQAMADSQGGNSEAARQRFSALLNDAPADASWRQVVEQQLAKLAPGKGPALDRETVASAEQMSAEDRQQMIAGMVDRLQNRLEGNGADLDGWLRLINARMVLGQKNKAQQAFFKAKQHFKTNQAAVTRLEDIGRRHGLKTTD